MAICIAKFVAGNYSSLKIYIVHWRPALNIKWRFAGMSVLYKYFENTTLVLLSHKLPTCNFSDPSGSNLITQIPSTFWFNWKIDSERYIAKSRSSLVTCQHDMYPVNIIMSQLFSFFCLSWQLGNIDRPLAVTSFHLIFPFHYWAFIRCIQN